MSALASPAASVAWSSSARARSARTNAQRRSEGCPADEGLAFLQARLVGRYAACRERLLGRPASAVFDHVAFADECRGRGARAE